MRLAFIGFRHAHIFSLLRQATEDPDIQVVAACESDPATAAQLAADGKVNITHTDHQRLLSEVDCDAVAIGDAYGRRGAIAIDALRAGRHVISDKPLCTRLEELAEIRALSEQHRLRIGCMLTMRSGGRWRAMRSVIQSGAIGPIHTVTFTGQHPLMLGTRPQWYFEPGMQGGTINDIAVHGLDLVPWMTGRRITAVVAARTWNARLPQYPHFHDGAQFMLRLDNGGGVLGDVSYFAPNKCGYQVPQYWRITCHGSEGVVEVDGLGRTMMATSSDEALRPLEAEPDSPGHHLDAFRREVAGASAPDDLTTAQVLAASHLALRIQQAADEQLQNLSLDA